MFRIDNNELKALKTDTISTSAIAPRSSTSLTAKDAMYVYT